MLCKRPALSIGAPFGELGGGDSLLGTFWKKRMVYLGSFSDPEDIKIFKSGAIWNFVKGIGFSWADNRLWGTKDHKA